MKHNEFYRNVISHNLLGLRPSIQIMFLAPLLQVRRYIQEPHQLEPKGLQCLVPEVEQTGPCGLRAGSGGEQARVPQAPATTEQSRITSAPVGSLPLADGAMEHCKVNWPHCHTRAVHIMYTHFSLNSHPRTQKTHAQTQTQARMHTQRHTHKQTQAQIFKMTCHTLPAYTTKASLSGDDIQPCQVFFVTVLFRERWL